MSLGKLTIDLLANIAKFESDMGRAAYIAKKNGEAIKESFKQVAEFALVGLGLEKAFETIKDGLTEAANLGHEFEEMGKKVGVSASNLSALKVVADESGLSMEQLQTGLVKFNKQIEAAAAGSKLQIAQFASLGVGIRDNNGHIKSEVDLLDQVAKKFSSYREGAVKSADATIFFGKAGAELIPFLDRLGGEGFAGALAEARKFGVFMNEDAIRASEDYRQSLIKLHEIVLGFEIAIATAVTPAVKGMVGVFTDYLTVSNTAAGRSEALKNFVLALAEGCIDLAGTARKAADGIEAIVEAVSAAIELAAKTPFGRIADDIQRMSSFNPVDQYKAQADLSDVIKLQEKNGNEFVAQLRDIRDRTVQAWTDIDVQTEAAKASFRKHAKEGVDVIPTPKLDAPLVPVESPHKASTRAADEQRRALLEYNKAVRDLAATLSGPASVAIAHFADEQARLDEIIRKGKLSDDDRRKATKLLAQAQEEAFAKMRADALGPAAQEAYNYGRQLHDLADEQHHGVLDAQQYASALALVEEQHRKNAVAAQRELDPTRALLEDMRFEADELGRTTAQRAADNFLRQQGIALDDKAAKGIRAQIEALQAYNETLQKTIAREDEFRGQTTDLFASILDGSKGPLAALKDFAIAVEGDFAKMYAQQWTDKLFGQQGQLGGGKFGGFLDNLFGGGAGGTKDLALNTNTSAIDHLTTAIEQLSLTGGGGFGGGGFGGFFSNIFGGSGSGASAGNFGGFFNQSQSDIDFASMFGGGLADGGAAQARKFYEVAERGPELLNIRNKTYLMMGRDSGSVTPNSRMAGSSRRESRTHITNINLPPASTRRTADMIATRNAREQRIAAARDA